MNKLPKCKYSAILIFGPPGIGKGTQAKLLAENPKYFHFSTGDMFRALKKNPEMRDSEIGKKVTGLIEDGNFVPDDLTIKLFYKTLKGYEEKGEYNPLEQTLLLDGIPRNSNQVELIKEKIDVIRVIYFYCSDVRNAVKITPKVPCISEHPKNPTNEQEDFFDDNILIERLKKRAIHEGRKDDREETIRKRLEIYKKDTEEVLNKYDPGLVLRINGMNSIDAISREVVTKLA